MTNPGALAPAALAELADQVVKAVTGCPDVVGLAQAPGGPVATYLPGRTISGVALREGEVEVCVNARYGPPLVDVAEQVRRAVAALAPGRQVDVVIGDITAGVEDPGAAVRESHSGRPAGDPGASGAR